MTFRKDIPNSKVSEFLTKDEEKSIAPHLLLIKTALEEDTFDANKVKKLLQKGVMTSSFNFSETDKTYASVVGPGQYTAVHVEGCMHFVELMLFADYLYVHNFKAFCDLVNAFDKTSETRAFFINAIEEECYLPTLKIGAGSERLDPHRAYVKSLFKWSQANTAVFEKKVREFKTYGEKVQAKEEWWETHLPKRLAPKAPIGAGIVTVAENLQRHFAGIKSKMEADGETQPESKDVRAPAEKKFELMKLKLELVGKIAGIRKEYSKDRNYSNTVIFLTNLISGLAFVPFGVANIVYHCKTGNWLLFDRDSTRAHTTVMARVGAATPLKPKFSRLKQD